MAAGRSGNRIAYNLFFHALKAHTGCTADKWIPIGCAHALHLLSFIRLPQSGRMNVNGFI